MLYVFSMFSNLSYWMNLQSQKIVNSSIEGLLIWKTSKYQSKLFVAGCYEVSRLHYRQFEIPILEFYFVSSAISAAADCRLCWFFPKPAQLGSHSGNKRKKRIHISNLELNQQQLAVSSGPAGNQYAYFAYKGPAAGLDGGRLSRAAAPAGVSRNMRNHSTATYIWHTTNCCAYFLAKILTKFWICDRNTRIGN